MTTTHNGGYFVTDDDLRNESDEENHGTKWSHDIFTCVHCGYTTNDTYTAGTINDLCNECPNCDTELVAGDKDAWCNLRHAEDCGWYDA